MAKPIVDLLPRSLVNGVRKKVLRKRLLTRLSSLNTEYAFSKDDIDLYVDERFVELPTVTSEINKEGSPELAQAIVKEMAIFWPSILPNKDLPWLYHEIFDDFSSNPSSYDHPSMDFGGRRWVMDAGAAEGYFSIFALRRFPGLLIAVEPLALMGPALTKTFDLHADRRQIIIVKAALADNPGWSMIQVNHDCICDSRLVRPSLETDVTSSDSVTERIPVTTIDHLVSEYQLSPGGMIKMDIEGFEMAALAGATRTLGELKPTLAIAVYHGLENANRCAEIIRAANPAYVIAMRGYYGYFDPPRPYMLFAY